MTARNFVMAVRVRLMRMPTRHEISLALISVLAASALPIMAAPEVKWASGLLSVKARGQPINTVLHEIEKQTGIVVKGGDALTEPAGSDFDRVPLVEGLRLLLASQSYLIVEGRGATPRPAATRVFVVGGASSGVVMGSYPKQAQLPTDSKLERAIVDVDPAVRIEAVERLGERGDERGLALVRQALSDPNEGVRAVATEALNARKTSAAHSRVQPQR